MTAKVDPDACRHLADWSVQTAQSLFFPRVEVYEANLKAIAEQLTAAADSADQGSMLDLVAKWHAARDLAEKLQVERDIADAERQDNLLLSAQYAGEASAARFEVEWLRKRITELERNDRPGARALLQDPATMTPVNGPRFRRSLPDSPCRGGKRGARQRGVDAINTQFVTSVKLGKVVAATLTGSENEATEKL